MKLRPVIASDWARLFAWRNDPDTRANFVQTDAVPIADHLAYLAALPDTTTRCLLIAELHGTPIGTVRLDLDDQSAELSLTIAPEHRERGFASVVLNAVVSRRDWFPGVVLRRFVADIKETNCASLRAFAAAGFEVISVGELVRVAR